VAVTRATTEPQIRPTVMLIDIDKFKGVNATLGLIVGDSVLLTVARRLSRHLGPQDTLARLAGDQFAAMLLPEHDERDLARLAEGIRSSLRAPIKIGGRDIVLTASIGMAVLNGQASSEELLKEAEIAMYRAKRGGSDRIEMFRPEFRQEVDERVTIESDLAKAIETGQLRVLYQPIIYLPTEELAGFEALVRWQHPRLGVLNPADFVPVAEQSDLIVRLGSFVLTQAVHDAAPWHKELPRADKPLFVSVNVSSRQLFRQDLIQEIRHIVGRAVVPPGTLRLEITESLVMENPEQAVEVLEWLRSAGAGLSLDDFGTGYSSLAYLQRFPFDTIKIDRDLVQSANSDPAGTAIVRSIVALAHELGKKVVAEGVEADTDAGFLRSIGCEYAQGFYYGEPMSERDVLQLLRVVRKSERRLQRRGFFRRQLELDHLLRAAFPQFDRHAGKNSANAVFPLEIHGAGQNLLLVFQDGFHHLHDGRGRRVIRSARLQQVDDFGAAVARALDDGVNTLFGQQLRQRNAGHGRVARQRHHGIAVAAEHQRVHVFHRYAQLLRHKRAHSRGIENPGHADHPMLRETADLVRRLRHGVHRIRHHDHDCVR